MNNHHFSLASHHELPVVPNAQIAGLSGSTELNMRAAAGKAVSLLSGLNGSIWSLAVDESFGFAWQDEPILLMFHTIDCYN